MQPRLDLCAHVVDQIRLRVLNTHKSVVLMSGWLAVRARAEGQCEAE